MIRSGSKYLDRLILPLILGDIGIIFLSWHISYFIRFVAPNLFVPSSEYLEVLNIQYFAASLLILIIYIIIASEVGLYSSVVLKSTIEQIYKIAILLLLTNSFWITLLFFVRFYSFSRIHNAIFTIIAFVGLIGYRYLISSLFYGKKSKIQRWNAIIVGTGELTHNFGKKIKSRPELGINLIGCIRTDQKKPTDNFDCAPLLGDIDNLETIIEKQSCDEVFVVIDPEWEQGFQTVDRLLKYQHLDVNLLLDNKKGSFINPEVNNFEDVSIIAARQYPLSGFNQFKKRWLDIIGSMILILVCIPFWLIIAFAIKITSAGPIFYQQKRLGLDGKEFSIIKFRSMHKDAETKTGPKWATAEDARTTAIGSFLRKTSIDETPQFINVLFGSMSLVGPRPERPEFIEQFRTQIPYYMARHRIKSGITGWAQINGWRGNTSLQKRIDHDLYYINHWSLWFDLRILFWTIFRGFINKNAY